MRAASPSGLLVRNIMVRDRHKRHSPHIRPEPPRPGTPGAAPSSRPPPPSAALLPLAGGLPSAHAAEGPAFLHGVASGDPLPDGVLLWTRVTPRPEAVPGSGKGAPVEVTWEVAEDEAFTTVVAQGTSKADGRHRPHRQGGRPRTAPGHHVLLPLRAGGYSPPPAAPVRRPPRTPRSTTSASGVVSCSNYEGGYFAAYRHLAARADLHAVLHLGDYIYEYGTGEYPLEGRHRPHGAAGARDRHPRRLPRTARPPQARPRPAGHARGAPRHRHVGRPRVRQRRLVGRRRQPPPRPRRATGRTAYGPRSRRTSSGCRCGPPPRAPPTARSASAGSPTCTCSICARSATSRPSSRRRRDRRPGPHHHRAASSWTG